MITCRHCYSTDIDVEKIIGYGDIAGVVYHHKLHCFNCGKTYMVERTKETYAITKNKKWLWTKSATRNKSKVLENFERRREGKQNEKKTYEKEKTDIRLLFT